MMINWLRGKLGISDLRRDLDRAFYRIAKLEDRPAPGLAMGLRVSTLEKKVRVNKRPMRHDQVNRAKKRQRKRHEK